MDQSVFHCFHSVNCGLSELRQFDRVLACGDMDGAADRLIDLWNILYKPTQFLTNLYDGEFWNDWLGRKAFEENLKEVYSLLNDYEENGTTLRKLETVRNYLHANFTLLQNAVQVIAADVGVEGLRQITHAEFFEDVEED